jgi:hypothetical protein
MLQRIGDALKSVLGLSGLAYIAGFIVVNTRLLAWGVGEGDLIDARYVAAGAIFLFVAIPTTLFPYLHGLASLNILYQRTSGNYFSAPLQALYQANRSFIVRWVGPFLVTLALFAALLEFYALKGSRRQVLSFIGLFALWYASSIIFSRLAVNLFNLGFYWRANMLVGTGPFWSSFQKSYIGSFIKSFTRTFTLTHSRAPSDTEVQDALVHFVVGGVGSEGFLASALYKGVALFLVSATTFGAFVYPALPASIGGGKPQNVVLLLSAEKSPGLVALGLPGTRIASGSKSKADSETYQLLTSPLPLVAKTSEGFYVLVPHGGGNNVIKIPSGTVDGVSYGTPR